jgi:hypothetical protein
MADNIAGVVPNTLSAAETAHVDDAAMLEMSDAGAVPPPTAEVPAPSELVRSIASDSLDVAGCLLFLMGEPEVRHNAGFADEMALMALRHILSALRGMYLGDIDALRNCASAALASDDDEIRFIGKCLAAVPAEPKLSRIAGAVCETFYGYRLKAQARETLKDFGANGADAVGNAIYEVADAVKTKKRQ